MSSICDNAVRRVLGVLAVAAFLISVNTVPSVAIADSLSVSVTPPLFQLSIGPGESWASSIKIVNSNSRAVTYYARVMDFEAKGEGGESTFIPLPDESNDPAMHPYSLARWIRLSQESVTVPAGQSGELPFSVVVPENAEPGGHYAAILVGTQPSAPTTAGAEVKVSSFVTSLMFVRIKGEVNERGRIREFLTGRSLYQKPEVDFSLRFENQGNSHLKPAGDIVIYNMWGKERGKVALNQGNGNFGNVLPDSVRKFEFTWAGESEPFDIGLYSAVVTLSYGEEAKQSVSARTYFWIVPVVPVAITFGMLLAFALMVTWFIRRYIRRALELERAYRGVPVARAAASPVTPPAPTAMPTVAILMEPLREGVIDLRRVAGGAASPVPAGEAAAMARRLTAWQWLVKYRLFILFLIIVCIGVFTLWRYFERTLTPARQFQITDVRIHEEQVSAQISEETQ